MKKIIIACDSYKGCLSSREVNEAIASGIKVWNAEDASSEIKKLSPDAASERRKLSPDEASPEIITLEMSDGGEGMLDAFLSAMKGVRVRIHAHDALMRWIEAEYGIVDDTATTEIYTLSPTRRSSDLLQGNPYQLWLLPEFPCWCEVWLECAFGLCRRYEICIHQGGCQESGRFRSPGQSLPFYVGLARLLDDDSIPEHYLGIHEYPAYSGIGWRSCILPPLRGNYRS